MRFTFPAALTFLATASSVLSLSTPHDGLLERRQAAAGSTATGSSSSGGTSSKTVMPSAPGPGDVFRAGQACALSWAPASSNKWKSMTISLMTGANQNMSKVEDVVKGIDGTTVTTYSWTCPEVTPYSAIYFYQFTNNADADPQWTTRFTLASPDGETTTPEFATQPEGPAIPWGIGKLANGASAGSSGSTGSSGSSGSAGSSNDTSSTGTTSTSASTAPTSSGTTSSSSSATSAPTSQTSAPSGAAGAITPLKATSIVAALAVAFLGAML